MSDINFVNIIDMEKPNIDGAITYKLKDGKSLSEIIDISERFIDPSYDSVFKTIFGDGNTVNNINGNQRLLDLLNSIVYANNTSKKFIKITTRSNEANIMDKETKGMLRLDISCEAKISDNNNKTNKMVNIEMQLGKVKDIIPRLYTYGNHLYRIYKKETYVIAFINNDYLTENNESQYIETLSFYPNGQKRKDLDLMKIIIVNLNEEIQKIRKNQKIEIMKNELDNKGICWLKLLGIRQWGITFDGFYYFPKNLIFPSEELKSAFMILKEYNESQLAKLINIEESDKHLIEVSYDLGREKGIKEGKEEGIKEGKEEGIKEGKEEGIKEGIEEGKKRKTLSLLVDIYNKKKESLVELIDLIDGENSTFKMEEIEKKFNEEPKKEEFIQLLQKKRKIIKNNNNND